MGEQWPDAPEYGEFLPVIATAGDRFNYDGVDWFTYCAAGSESYCIQRSNNVFRFECRPGDTATVDVATGNTATERAEIGYWPLLTVGAVNVIEFQTMTETNAQKTSGNFAAFFQLHATKDSGEISTHPPFHLNIADNMIWDCKISSTAENPLVTPPAQVLKYTDKLQAARWNSWKVRVKHDWTSSGLVQLWQNGVLLFDYLGPFGYNDALGLLVEFGIYRGKAAGSDPTMVTYMTRPIVTQE